MTIYHVDGFDNSALHLVHTLLPGCSAAIGVLHNGSTLRRLSARGPESSMLLEGRALTAAYRGLRSRMALMEPFAVERPAGRQLISLPIRDDEHTARGVLQVLTDQEPPVKVLETLEALTHVIAQMLRQTRLNGELQHSLNQLFLVHQVGREFNLATSLDAVLIQVRDQLAGTLNFHHCCVLLLHDRRHLLPEAGIGIDPRWVEQARPALERSVARRVLESGVAEQVSDPVTLADLDLPTLEDGTPPAAVLCAPLSTRMGIIGFIELYTSTLYAFTADEVFLLSVLATEVATAVENAQLYESLREKEERLTTLAHKLIHSQEEERRRIARDMHDGLAQLIVSAFQLLQAHAYTVPQSADRKPLDRGLAMLADCIDESRKVIFDLRPATLDDFGLVLALRQYLSTLESELGWQTEFSLVGHIGALSPAMEIAIFRLVQEALTNVRKHARTMKVLVRLACTPTTLVITVRDWGCGFDVQEAAHRNGHLGLTGMKERVALLHGDFHLRSRPGAGTLVRITIPLE